MCLSKMTLLVNFCFFARKPSDLTPQTNVIKIVLLNNKSLSIGWSLIPASLKHSTEPLDFQ